MAPTTRTAAKDATPQRIVSVPTRAVRRSGYDGVMLTRAFDEPDPSDSRRAAALTQLTSIGH